MWAAVAVGWMTDFALRILLQLAVGLLGFSEALTATDPSVPAHLVVLALLLLATALGGFVAGRIAEHSPALHGLLVGVTGILATAISNPGIVPVPRPLVITQALSLLSGAVGALIARAVMDRDGGVGS
ncbi:MAG: TIGR04086 family membrane protein [Oscillochloridaceae bacterium umkhey_bin13]